MQYIYTTYRNVCTCIYAYMLSYFSRVQLCETLWIVAHQTPLSMGFPGQEYWSGLTFPSPGDLPDPGIKLESLTFSAMASGFFTTSTTCGLPSMGSHRVRHD